MDRTETARADTGQGPPIAGLVQVLGVGAVVQPGGALLDLVPSDEPMLVDARVQPADVESVREGLPAEVRLLAFK